MKLTNIDVISIPVTDQEQALDFYNNVLGFEIMVDSIFEEGKRWLQLKPSQHAETSISLVNWFEGMKPGSMDGFVITTGNIEETYKTLRNKEVHVSPIDETPWGKFVYLKDPDGNGIMINEQE